MRPLLFSMFILACGGTKPSPSPASAEAPPAEAAPSSLTSDIDAVVVKMGTMADQACACTDAACAERVQASMVAWSEEMETSPALRDATPSEAQTQVMSGHATRYADCFTKAMSAGGEAPAP